MKRTTTMLLVAMALSAAACETEEYGPAAFDVVEMSPSSANVGVGDTARLQARALAGAREITGVTFLWSSSDTTVVRVVTAGSTARLAARRAGSAVIRASAGGIAGTVLVQVENPVPQASALVPASAPAGAGSVLLEVTGARFSVDARVLWNGSELATTYVNAGLLRVQLDAGRLASEATAEVTVVNGLPGGGSSQPLQFVVSRAPVAWVQLEQTVATLQVGDTLRLRAVTRDTQGRELAGRAIDWQSDQPQVATVSAHGVVTARAAGSTVIIAQSEGRHASVLLNVTAQQNPVPHVTSLAPDSAPAGRSFVITVRGSGFRNGVSHAFWNSTSVPADIISDTEMHVTLWEDMRRVAATGTVSVFNAGPGGGWSNSRTFRITPAVNTVQVTPQAAFMWPGERMRFTAAAFDERGQAMPDRAFTWEAQHANILTVDANGMVHAHAVGTSLVRARVDDRTASGIISVLAPPQQNLLVEAQTATGPELWVVDVTTPSTSRVRLMPGRYARDAAVSPDGNRIAFTGRNAQGNEDIYVADRDGTNVRRLTTHAALDDQPAWSPDGRTIAFRSRRTMYDDGFEGYSGIWLMDADGSNQRNIPVTGWAMPHAEDPAFSPDGGRLYAAVGDLNLLPLHTMLMAYDFGNAQWRMITDGNIGSDDDPAVSPDGRIVIVRRRTGNTSVLQRIDPENKWQYVFDYTQGRVPAYDAAGRFVAFEHEDEQGRASVYVTTDNLFLQKLIVVSGKNPVWIRK